MSLRVVSAGTHSLVVDAGRRRSRGLGIPVGGPADRLSLALGNALVGNSPFAPALEITLFGPTLSADADIGVCVFGAPFRLERDGQPLPAGYTFTLAAGQTLAVGGTPSGCRAYLCVPGGFHVPTVLDSATGFDSIRVGDKLQCDPSRLSGRSLALNGVAGPNTRSAGAALRCLPGAQADWFDDSLFAREYLVAPASDRMGVRLDGPLLALPKRDLLSEPVAPGTVQITNDGAPIVLGVDGQTIGGYPKIAHVISADLDTVGQLRPGDLVRFQKVTEAAAEEAAARWRKSLREWLVRIAVSQGY